MGSSPDESRPHRLLLVDDHPIIRAALRAQLNGVPGEFLVVGEASNARAALKLAEAHGVDVVLIDLELDRDWGMDLLLVLKSRFPELRVLVFTAHDDPMLAQRAIDLGALGYVAKTDDIALVDALRAVARGEVFLGPSIATHLVRRWRTRSGQLLSDREVEIFRLIGRGHETKDIASALGVSVKTVETHRARIRNKLGIRGVGELIVRAALFARGQE
ncbi:response regulator [Sandaracinus amylolyticus]|uniref:DNA-binding response regulator, LuxR family n=1 Tax=Sandaracinus amylolyticus TaxID=927083 RepID=A0A0F6SHX6_9BACT|nr:response regulator transcription factor [Sandaracinus amylolyticus]AKF11209.1 DNA-binding response regulator, LuxR family [Sandaracinus amylolyticus]